jgi:O-antigen/teichoic acid export membrane protein
MLREGRGLRQIFADNPDISRYSLTTNFAQTLSMTTKQLPLFLVGGLTGTAAAGAFRLAAQLARSLTILSQMIARAAFPEIVRAIRNHGVLGLSAVLKRSFTIAFAVSAIALIIVVTLGEPALKLVGGRDFGQGYYSLVWLAAAGCVDLASVALEPALMAAHRAHLAFFARLVGTVGLIGGSVALEPMLGAQGIAMAVFVNALVQALLLGVILLGLMQDKREEAPGDIQEAP